jgi:hypothetical protein
MTQKKQIVGRYTGFHRRQSEKNRQQTNKAETAQKKFEVGPVQSMKGPHPEKLQGIVLKERAAEQ